MPRSFDRRSVLTHFDYELIISKGCQSFVAISGMIIEANASIVRRRNEDMRTINHFIDVRRIISVLAAVLPRLFQISWD